jgi:hypothetical protein
MNLYQIEEQMSKLLNDGWDYDCIDMETGEILEDKLREKLAALEIEESVKIENTALFMKNLAAETEAIKAEEKTLADRRKSKEKKYEWLKNYLTGYLLETGKMKFESAKCALSFRKSEALEITDEHAVRTYAEENARYLKYSEPKLDIAEIKKAVKSGEAIPGVIIKEKQNIQIK